MTTVLHRPRPRKLALPPSRWPVFGMPAASPDVAELAKTFETYHAETKQIGADVKKLATAVEDLTKHHDELAKRVNRPGIGTDREPEARKQWNAVAKFARGDEGAFREIRGDMSVSDDTQGGYLVMPALSARMTKKLFDQTPMRRLARVETITAGDRWEEPVDFDDIGAEWVGEKDSRPKTDTPELNKLTVPVEEIYANQVVTQRLLDDAGFDLGQWLDGKVTDKFARTEGAAFVNGNGIKKPLGILGLPAADYVTTSDATRAWGKLQYVPSAAAAAVTADALRALTWSLRAPYRQGASWLMNSNSASAIDQLKDGQGSYIWRTSSIAGVPPALLGHVVEFSEDMPDVGSGAFSIAFGNWKLGYVIVDKAGIRFLRDPFTDKPNLRFYAYRRVGGGVANTEAIKLMKIGTS